MNAAFKRRRMESCHKFTLTLFNKINNNKFVGHIPTTIGEHTNLQTLYSLSTVSYLDMQNMLLSGSIPSTVSFMISLQHMLLNNKIFGTIPSTMGSLSSLQTLTLSGNSLSGSVPSTLRGHSLTNMGFYAAKIICYATCLTTLVSLYAGTIFGCSPNPTWQRTTQQPPSVQPS